MDGTTTSECISRIHPWDNERSSGLDISFAVKGYGFGHITIARNKATGVWAVDDEETGPTHIAKILMALVGTDVQNPGADPVLWVVAGPGVPDGRAVMSNVGITSDTIGEYLPDLKGDGDGDAR